MSNASVSSEEATREPAIDWEDWRLDYQDFCESVESEADKWAELQRYRQFYKCLNESKGPYCE